MDNWFGAPIIPCSARLDEPGVVWVEAEGFVHMRALLPGQAGASNSKDLLDLFTISTLVWNAVDKCMLMWSKRLLKLQKARWLRPGKRIQVDDLL